ncbi:glycosyltransferase family 4 protein [Prosthecobacter sp.]|uniref:glycosyltransferase family 4 protein n=1 Tax=Prosthecobacter sp. TaxID=1965333 RepID=UPI0025DAD396|nr:glycosyltransferase family 4 protein [Prosthecobacter sp.]
MRRGSIHIWVPGIQEGTGGIQAFSRIYVQALAEAFAHLEIRVFVKNDLPPPGDLLRLKGVTFYSMAHYPKWTRALLMVVVGLAVGVRERPRCVITTHLHFQPAVRMLNWLCGIPVMSVLHGIEAWSLPSGLRIWAMRAADHLMAVSHHTRKVVIDSYGLNPDKISVVPNTFDADRFTIGPKPEHLLARYGLKPGQPVVMTVSRLVVSERYKGHRQILQALESIRNLYPDLRYLVVGTGDDMLRLQEITKASNLEECVIFAGHIPAEELPDHYKLCDVFAMPSSKEGFGIVFLEAMASGKPVVAGNLDGSVDALDQGRLGMLVDPHDPVKIAEKICLALEKKPAEALWNSPEMLRDAVISQFGYERVGPMMAKVVAQLMENPSFSADSGGEGRGQEVIDPLPHIVILTQLTSPYQVEFFNALAASEKCHLEVIYLTSRDKNRQWVMPGISHGHLILSENPGMRSDALEAIQRADLVVFNFYTDLFALRAIRERVHTRRPWVFWGERPGAYQAGIWGVMARWVLLRPLHRNNAPIWAVGAFGVEGYRREFGGSRSYSNIPYFSMLKRFMALPLRPVQQRTFFYSGSFSPRKGVDVLAAAFAQLARQHPEARLVLMGAGPLEGKLRHLLRNCSGQVTWLGFQSWDKLPEGYAQGAIFCFPSRYDGWGLALVEALASGMPAIGTERTGAAIEFLKSGKSGRLISAGDSTALKNAMLELLQLPDAEFECMQQAARQSVAANTLDQGVKRFMASATDVLQSWRARVKTSVRPL